MKRGFWLNISVTTALCILLIASSYAWWFYIHLDRPLSPSGEQWGQFGDFFGGILNPLLSFMTICILIRTSIHQEKQEVRKRFDNRFYNMVDQLRKSSENLNFKFGSKVNWDFDSFFKFMEDTFFDSDDVSGLNSPRFKEAIFPILRQFYLILKVINTEYEKGRINGEELQEYFLLLINSTEYRTLRFVLFNSLYYESISASQYIINCNGFMSELKSIGFESYINRVNVKKIEIKRLGNEP
ncbi:hypothetical protein [Pantoea agglomerans]|uniref:hypothetical protein n=1 Tax=Enterobacter agglomerans TaxID=549 RepID=UPI00104389C4|nr:hypothetical protein [Pantoea agglomerans]TCZ21616.1 hypothetical protein EYB39_23790 [Pantoea agglomerans]